MSFEHIERNKIYKMDEIECNECNEEYEYSVCDKLDNNLIICCYNCQLFVSFCYMDNFEEYNFYDSNNQICKICGNLIVKLNENNINLSE